MKKKSISQLKKLAVKTFNAWIRARDVKKLNGRCYTCPKPGEHAGHFRHNNNATRFSEIFVNLQCRNCNVWKSGNLGEYALRLVEEYGKEEVNRLYKLSFTTKRFTIQEYEELIEKYTL